MKDKTEAGHETVAKFIDATMKEQKVSDNVAAERMGYNSPTIIRMFRDEPARTELVTVRDTPTGPLLHLARPITVRTEGCLSCHSTSYDAPQALTRTYGTTNGFGWKLNETIGAQILSVPMALPLKVARDAFVTFLIILVTMVYGPVAAALVELFPTRIRYTSMSLPYHVGNGVFGGLVPAAGASIAALTGIALSGLAYPMAIAAIGVVVSLSFLREPYHQVKIWDEVGGAPPLVPDQP